MTTTGLAKKFSDLKDYRPQGDSYRFLPFRFGRLDQTRYLLTNECGEYVVLPSVVFQAFVEGRLRPDELAYRELKSSHLLLDGDSSVALDLLALR